MTAGLHTIKEWGRRYAYLLLLALPFLAMEAGVKIIGRNINYFRQAMVFPNILFILIWTGLIVGVTNCLTGRTAKIFYNVVFVLFFFMYIVHGAYYEITNYFFGFSLLESASEGSSYILDAILSLKPWFYVTLAVILFLFFFAKAHTPGWKRGRRNSLNDSAGAKERNARKKRRLPKENIRQSLNDTPEETAEEKRVTQDSDEKQIEEENSQTGDEKEKEEENSQTGDEKEEENSQTGDEKEKEKEEENFQAGDEKEIEEESSGTGDETGKGEKKERYGLRKTTSWRMLLMVLAVFVVLHLITPLFYGAANEELEWDTWRNPHNVYENFNDSNKCMLICGLMEYTVRDFYVTFLKPADAEDEEELAFLAEVYSTSTVHEENALTGIFEGKNVIFLQLEGMDSWLITEEDTPNLYALMNNSIVFENHYSYFTGGGSTFNSELAVNTGFITPVSYTKNPYSFTTNSFPYSLARMFGSLGYAVNCFHMNTEEYYQRGINYKNWGYDHYYSLLDENDYSDLSYELDRELILDEDFYDRLFTQYAITVTDTDSESGATDAGTAGTGTENGTTESGSEEETAEIGMEAGTTEIGTEDETTDTETEETGTSDAGDEAENHFAHYIITYTPHTPFVTDRGVGQYLAELIYGDDIPEMDEEAVARMMAGETDYMVGLLIQALKDNGLYENTVIVAYADHYLYTLSDEAILEKYKTTDNNLINQTPFFIWSSDVAEIAEQLLKEEAEGKKSGETDTEQGDESPGEADTEQEDESSGKADTEQEGENTGETDTEQGDEAAGEADANQTEENSNETDSDFTGFAGSTILDGQGTVKLLADGSVSIHISKVNSQIDILPTVLNLFGIAYDDEYYVGSDIFDSNYSGYVFFSDYSWYNGTVYASSSDDYQILSWQASLDSDVTEEEVLNMFTKITDLIRKNDLTLKYDYQRRVY